jgi:hypothetical protein
MRYPLLVIMISLSISSCFLLPTFRKSRFQYRQDGVTHLVPIVIPKGYVSVETKNDSAGNELQIYHYPGGAILYASHLSDTMIQIQPIDKSVNMPRLHPNGGLVYKGQDSTRLFWKEIRRKNFRFGYRFVNSSQEGLFDSSTNFMSLQQLY